MNHILLKTLVFSGDLAQGRDIPGEHITPCLDGGNHLHIMAPKIRVRSWQSINVVETWQFVQMMLNLLPKCKRTYGRQQNFFAQQCIHVCI